MKGKMIMFKIGMFVAMTVIITTIMLTVNMGIYY
jgi:hypothetical protein